MRVLLAGASGVDKDIAIANLLGRLRAHGEVGGPPAGEDNAGSAAPGATAPASAPDPALASASNPAPDPQEVLVAGIEGALAARGHELAGVLAAFRPTYQLAAWRQAGQDIADELAAAAPRHAIIAAHLTYYTSGRQFSLIDLPTIRRWRPDCIITLVDDMLDIHAALRRRDTARHTNFQLRLREILGWRSAEIAMADLLARNLYSEYAIPHYVVSVKHPAEMLYRLIFRRGQYPLVYASFPITAVRDDPERRAAIDDIRRELHRRFIVFDPLTLDEGTPQVFEKAQAAVAAGQPEIVICAGEARWPLDPAGTLCEHRPSTYPMTLDPQEALEVWDDMENQVRHRDLTMVEQAQCVAAYRITMGGRLSTGMYSELMYASHTAEPARPALMYADPADGGLDHPFLRNFNHRTFYRLEDWCDAISDFAPEGAGDAQQPLF